MCGESAEVIKKADNLLSAAKSKAGPIYPPPPPPPPVVVKQRCKV